MHQFHLGQTVVYRARYAPPGACVVTAKLPERNGEYEYRVRNSADANERLARESELQAMSENKAAPAAKGRCVSHRAPQHARVPPVDYGDDLRAGLTRPQEPDITICIQRRYSTRAVAWSRSIGMGGRNPRNRWLRSPECTSDPLDGVAPVFFAQIQEALDTPWALAAVADFVYPETRGERPPDLDATLRFAQGIMRLSARDAEVHKLRMEVMNLPKPRSLCRDPALAARVR